MFSLSAHQRYYLYAEACDMRKSFDSLSGLIRTHFDREPGDGSVYVFLNRRRTHIKLLQWESGGFVLYYKRLERGTFPRPRWQEESGLLHWPELVLMGAGMEVQTLRKQERFELNIH